MRGQPQRAVELLRDRFALYEQSLEGDSPRRATLWLQRALYEAEYDAVAAAGSVAQCKAMFDRIGGAQPQWKAVLNYLDARLDANNPNAAAVRAAQDAVDRAFLRQRPSVWRVPYMSSL